MQKAFSHLKHSFRFDGLDIPVGQGGRLGQGILEGLVHPVKQCSPLKVIIHNSTAPR